MLKLELPLFFLRSDSFELELVPLHLLLDLFKLGLAVKIGLMKFSNLERRGLALSNRLGDAIVQFLESDHQSEILTYVIHRYPLLQSSKEPIRYRCRWPLRQAMGPPGFEPGTDRL